MQKDILETLNKLSETTLENYRKMGEANMQIGEKLLQEQAELTSSLINTTKGKAEKMTSVKDYQGLAAQQAELVQECSELVWQSCKNCAEIMTEAGKLYNQLWEAGLKASTGNLNAKAGAKSRKSA